MQGTWPNVLSAMSFVVSGEPEFSICAAAEILSASLVHDRCDWPERMHFYDSFP